MPGEKISPIQLSYAGNKISTTRYNLITYIPVSLFIQFYRVTNIFYVINGILQTIPSIRTNSPIASLVPMAFVVLLGMLREGLADIRRWREDRRTNARLYTRLENPHDLSQKK